MSDDVIRRSDAIKAFTFNSKGERIPFVDCDNFPVEFPLRYIVDTLAALPSADKPSAADLSSVYSTAYKSGYDKGYADAVQGIADELVKQGKHIEVDRPQGEWIPCSERLPSEQGQYLITFPLCNGDPWVYVLSFNKGKFYETDDEWCDVEYDDVTAWMPLPKPYGEREGE